MKFNLIALFALVSAAPLAAQDTAPAPEQKAEQPAEPASPPQAAVKPQEKVCKYMPRTGSRFQKKVCRTPEQWEAMAEAAKSGLGELQRQPQGLPDGST